MTLAELAKHTSAIPRPIPPVGAGDGDHLFSEGDLPAEVIAGHGAQIWCRRFRLDGDIHRGRWPQWQREALWFAMDE